MSNETRSTLLEPVTPQNAVLLLIDQQEGLLARVYEPEHMRGHLLGLARGAQLLGVPVVMTTALSAGTNGPQWHALTTLFADGDIIDRTLINAWQDPRVHEAITRTGRTKVIIAGSVRTQTTSWQSSYTSVMLIQ
jgi:nicotinamidase-related amidase